MIIIVTICRLFATALGREFEGEARQLHCKAFRQTFKNCFERHPQTKKVSKQKAKKDQKLKILNFL